MKALLEGLDEIGDASLGVVVVQRLADGLAVGGGAAVLGGESSFYNVLSQTLLGLNTIEEAKLDAGALADFLRICRRPTQA